jgi:hypothetical protein
MHRVCRLPDFGLLTLHERHTVLARSRCVFSLSLKEKADRPSPSFLAMCRMTLPLSSILDVITVWLLILGAEEAAAVACKPGAELADFFAESVHRLVVHVGLSNELWQVDCSMLASRRYEKENCSHTKHSAEMLCTVCITCSLAFPLRVLATLPQMSNLDYKC